MTCCSGIDDKQLYNLAEHQSLLLGSYAKNRALLALPQPSSRPQPWSSYSDQEIGLDTPRQMLGQAPRHWPLSLLSEAFQGARQSKESRSLVST